MQTNLATDLESVKSGWHTGNRRQYFRHLMRAGIARAEEETRREQWNMARANGLERDLESRLAKCGEFSRQQTCDCRNADSTKKRHTAECGCGLWWICPKCGDQYNRTRKRKLTQSIGRTLAHYPQWQTYLCTLTASKSDDPHEDLLWWQGALSGLTKAINRRTPAAEVIINLESTDGRDGRPHPHAHLVIVCRYFECGQLWKLWRHICRYRGRDSDHVDVKWWRGARRPGRMAELAAAYYAGRTAAGYLQGDDVSDRATTAPERTDDKGEKNVLSNYALGLFAGVMTGRRKLRATIGFWDYDRPSCPCCKQTFDLVQVGPTDKLRHQTGHPPTAPPDETI